MTEAPGSVRIRVLPFGDAAVLIDLGRPPGLETTRLVHDLTRHLADGLATATTPRPPGFEPPVPAAGTILVPLDPLEPGVPAALELLRAIVDRWDPTATRANHGPAAPLVEIPVIYGGTRGPDLAEVAGLAGLSTEQVIAAHSRGEYAAAFLGFAPGFGYLGPLPPELVLARRPVPRPRVQAGSVAIGGPQTAVYPVDGPGGWWLIGWTPLTLWDAARTPPAILEPGTRVRFRPIPAG